MAKEIIVFGSIVHDLFSYSPRFPLPGESIRGTHFSMGAGGKGANSAVMASKLGSKVVMVSKVGNDYFGEFNIDSLKTAGVETKYIEKSETAQTATATVIVTGDGENHIVVTLGACMELSTSRACELTNVIAQAGLVLCQNEVPYEANLQAMKIAKSKGVTTFYNPAPGLPNFDRSILEFVDIVCMNRNEAEFLLNKEISTLQEFEWAAEESLVYGPKTSIITLGKDGTIVAFKKNNKVEVRHIEAPKVTAVDTTGAGDCFCGSLAHFLNSEPKEDILKSVRKAIKIASISVQRKGTQTSYPSIDELKELNIIGV